MAPARPSASLAPGSRRATAQPTGWETWRAAPSPWFAAALHCWVMDTLEIESDVTPERTNRSSSREEAARPPSLCFRTRVSERARAEGAGASASRVARMSDEAPPL